MTRRLRYRDARAMTALLCAAAILAGGLAHAVQPPDPLAVVLPADNAPGNIDKLKFKEPSDIVFHPGRHTLFVVGDDGEICEMRTDGTRVQHWKSATWIDLEGITVDAASGLLYVAVEGEDTILEIDPNGLARRRTFPIQRSFQGVEVLKAGGQGVEAICFMPDPKHAEGGTFLIANQGFELGEGEDASAIFEVVVPLRTGRDGSPAHIIRRISPGVVGIAGLHSDAGIDHVLARSDTANVLLEMTRSGEILRSWAFPGDEQEGIAFDDQGFLYYVQDPGGIIKMRWDTER